MSAEWALVTGASDGIGRAVATRLAESGRAVVIVARRADALDMLATQLRLTHNVEVRVVVADFADPAAAAHVDSATRDLNVSIAILAAGYGSAGRFDAQPLAGEVAMVQVNCGSVVDLSGRFLARFRALGRGHLVLFGSIVGFCGVPYTTTYAATKNFVQAFAEGLQSEVAGSGISVLSVAPGPTNTGFAARARMQMGAALTSDAVARAIMSSLTRNGTIKPGALTKLLHYSLAMLGRRGRSFAMGKAMQDMARTKS